MGTVEFELPLSWYSHHHHWFHNGSLIAIGFTVLGLSWWSFRRQDSSPKKIVAAYSALAAAVFLISLPLGYLNRFADSFYLHGSQLAQETKEALRLLSYRDRIDHGSELTLGAKMSPEATKWLRNVHISIVRDEPKAHPRLSKTPFPEMTAYLYFPNGGVDYLTVKLPSPTNKPASRIK